MTRDEMWKEFENQLKREVHTPMTMSYDDSMRCAELGIEEVVARWKERLGQESRWISVKDKLPETDNKNEINNYNVLLWVKNKSHPEREPQIYLGKLKPVEENDSVWGRKTKPCEWTIWGWSYFNEPEVIAWMPLPGAYTESEE